MALAGWANKQRFDPGGGLLPTPLAAFTGPVHLSAACGVNGYNLSQIISDLTPTSDDFTGSDGAVPNPLLWTATASGAPFNIQGNTLRSVHTSATDSIYFSTFYFPGDLDIQVDFGLLTYPATNSWYLFFQLVNEDVSKYSSSSIFYSSGRKYNHVPSWVAGTESATTDISGKLRLVRAGTTYYLHTWNGAGWSLFSTKTGGPTDNLYVRLRSYTAATMSFSAFFDNFQINSGTVVFPIPKKLALEIGDTGTELPIGIRPVDWNASAETAIIYPEFTSVGQTDHFNFYWDSTHADNPNVTELAATPGAPFADPELAAWNLAATDDLFYFYPSADGNVLAPSNTLFGTSGIATVCFGSLEVLGCNLFGLGVQPSSGDGAVSFYSPAISGDAGWNSGQLRNNTVGISGGAENFAVVSGSIRLPSPAIKGYPSPDGSVVTRLFSITSISQNPAVCTASIVCRTAKISGTSTVGQYALGGIVGKMFHVWAAVNDVNIVSGNIKGHRCKMSSVTVSQMIASGEVSLLATLRGVSSQSKPSQVIHYLRACES